YTLLLLGFTYACFAANPEFAPSATITVNDNSVCINAASPIVTFTGSGGTAPYTFKYTVNGGPIITISSAGNSATTAVPTNVAGTFTYALVSVKDISPDPEVSLNLSKVITVSAMPTVDFISNANINTCSGTSVSFTAQVAGTGPFTYHWDF